MLAIHGRGAVSEIVLDRPPVNAIDDDMIRALHGAIDETTADGTAQVLHFRSAGKVFAAGADLALIRSWQEAPAPGAYALTKWSPAVAKTVRALIERALV